MLNRKIILTLTMALMLTACETADQFFIDAGAALRGGRPESETVYVNKDSSGYVAGGKMETPVTDQAIDNTITYDRMASNVSDDSVQLFSLDEPGQSLSPYPESVTPAIQGMPSSTDPSVTVFPFSDDLYTPGIRPGITAPGPRGGYAMAESLPLYTGNPNTIYFDHGSAALSATARQAIASAAQSYGGMIAVEGHASRRAQTDDPEQRGILNLQMSMKRAMAVTKQLIRDGVPPESIRTTAYGDARPVAMETDSETEAQNRRVEILTGAR